MIQESNFARWCKIACGGLFLPFVLTGCGGSSSSSSLSNPATNDPIVIAPASATAALISQTSTRADGATIFSNITVDQTGAASYTLAVDSTPSQRQSGTGTYQSGRGILSAAQSAKFFQDLANAQPLPALPVYGGPIMTFPTPPNSLTVQYQGQTGHIDDPSDAHEVALAADSSAITADLGIPQ